MTKALVEYVCSIQHILKLLVAPATCFTPVTGTFAAKSAKEVHLTIRSKVARLRSNTFMERIWPINLGVGPLRKDLQKKILKSAASN